MNNTEKALKNYIDDLCINFTPNNLNDFNLFIKAAMEFVLLCYVCKIKSNLPMSYIKSCQEIAKKIDNESFKLNKTFGFKYIFEFLGIPNKVIINESKDIRDYFPNKSLLMEVAFVLDVFKNDLSKGYWDLAAFEIYKNIQNNGLNIENCYQITHLIMFGTQMGQRELSIDCSEKTVKICKVILSEIEIYAQKTEYWDLLLEVYISQIYLNNFNKNDLIFSLPKYNSYYLTKGSTNTNYKENIKNPFHNLTYQLFHTTLVKCLLDIELKEFKVSNWA